MAATKRGFLRDAWRLAGPYLASEEKRSACGLLTAVIALNLISVWLNVRLNTWNNAFYDALQNYNWDMFWYQFAVFGVIAFSLIIVAVYQLYLSQILQIRWRRWLTRNFVRDWLSDQAYYRMQLDQTQTDNPDQRISDDLDRYTSSSLSLSVGLLNSVVTLISFLFILWNLSGSLRIPLGHGMAIHIPAYMVFAAFLYAIVGTWLTRRIGFPLVRLIYDQQRYEADFRFSLVRLRENAESVAFFGGEGRETGTFETRFSRIVANWWGIIRRTKKLSWFTNGYQQVAIIFPFVVAAPRYFSKAIKLGGLMQIASAFGQVQSSLSYIVNSYTTIAEYQSVVERLADFHARIDAIARSRRATQPIEVEHAGTGVAVAGLDLDLPDGQPLRRAMALEAQPEKPLLITGPSGAGKSTLLRAIAGLWPFGRGRIRIGEGEALFLPQHPYLPLGTLGDALVYPGRAAAPARAELAEALVAVGLPHLVDQLEEDANWAQRLSGGEQQRVAFARVLLVRPQIVFLDEATSALDEAAEASLYRLLREAPWHPTIVSVGHRSTLRRFHDTVIDLAHGQITEAAAG